MIAKLGADTKCVATGGLAHLIADESKYITEVNDMLTLDGLCIIYERSRNAKSSPHAAEAQPPSS